LLLHNFDHSYSNLMPNLDLTWARAQFPSLTQTVNGRSVIFFDGPGGTQVPQQVIAAISDYLSRSNANSHGAFATSERTDQVITSAHASVADFLGCDQDEVIFGPNMTYLTFALSRAIGRDLHPGDEIVVTQLDHDANFSSWLALEEGGVVVRVVGIQVEDCTLDMEDLVGKINDRTRLVAVGYASNAVGTINDVAEVVRLAHRVGALAFIDAVHYAPHGPIDVRALDCDFLACSPYKFFGPHSGVLYGKRRHLTSLRPYKVQPVPDVLPDRWESGTQNHEALAGVAAAIDYLAELGYRAGATTGSRRDQLQTALAVIRAHELQLVERLITGLLSIPGATVYGIREVDRFAWRTPTVSIRLAGYSPRELAEKLGERGIFTWDGNHYALNLTTRLGVESSGGLLRIGLTHYNTANEVDQLLETLQEFSSRRTIPVSSSKFADRTSVLNHLS
jgi:cysteine desulfurase family protein (TIGR01976 family)